MVDHLPQVHWTGLLLCALTSGLLLYAFFCAFISGFWLYAFIPPARRTAPGTSLFTHPSLSFNINYASLSSRACLLSQGNHSICLMSAFPALMISRDKQVSLDL